MIRPVGRDAGVAEGAVSVVRRQKEQQANNGPHGYV